MCGALDTPFRKRLQSAYGDDWWERGVLSALHEDQRENLETQIQRYPARDPIAALDHAHFGWIVRRHAAAAFSDIFGDSEAAYRRFRRVALMRNDWAHVQALSMFGVMQVIDTMKSILASLRRGEALEIEKISQGIEPQPGDTAGDFMAEQTISDMEEIEQRLHTNPAGTPAAELLDSASSPTSRLTHRSSSRRTIPPQLRCASPTQHLWGLTIRRYASIQFRLKSRTLME